MSHATFLFVLKFAIFLLVRNLVPFFIGQVADAFEHDSSQNSPEAKLGFYRCSGIIA